MLTEIEIKQIQTYCVLAGIEYYDVELELVDHMAEWVSEKMLSQGINFDEAVNQLPTSFSKVELMEIVAQKRILVRKKILRLYKHAFLSYFKFPQIALTFLLVALVIYLGDKKNAALNFPGSAMHVMNLIVFTFAWGRAKIIKENKEDLRVPLLSEKVLSAFSKFFIFHILIYAILNLIHVFEATIPLIIYKISMYLFPLFVMTALAWRKVYIDMHHKIRELYPMAFSS
ncbi:MAG: hypothetical protein WCH78_04830 [Bacteroidota bacterium]